MTLRTNSFDRSFDRTFDRAFEQLASSFFDVRRPTGPVVDATWTGEHYVITVDLPGTPASAVSVDVAGTTLTIAVDTAQLQWKRSVRLGGRLDSDKVSANHVDGRLTVTIGTVDAPVARAIEIATDVAAIEATSSTVEASDDQPSDDQPSETNSQG